MSGQAIFGAIIFVYVLLALPLLVYERRPNLLIPDDSRMAEWEARDRKRFRLMVAWVAGLFVMLAVWKLAS